jgi:hypothetical protein
VRPLPSKPFLRCLFSFLTCLGTAACLSGQVGSPTRYAQPIPMPEDRAKDSNEIYSQLLKSGPIEWRNVGRKQWLIEASTNAMPLDVSCGPVAEHTDMNQHTGGMEPRTSVQAPAERQSEWNEVLADYDKHCHDVVQLDQQSLKADLPVHFLNAADKQNYMKNPRTPPAVFADGAGLHRFTEVFFNRDHSLALVEQGMWCGGLCGNWTWVVLERQKEHWKVLPWVHTFMVS